MIPAMDQILNWAGRRKYIAPFGVFTFSTLAINVATSLESMSLSEFFFVRRFLLKSVEPLCFFFSRLGDVTALFIAFCMFSLRDFLLTSPLLAFFSGRNKKTSLAEGSSFFHG